jgi:hypothetical protein
MQFVNISRTVNDKRAILCFKLLQHNIMYRTQYYPFYIKIENSAVLRFINYSYLHYNFFSMSIDQ